MTLSEFEDILKEVCDNVSEFQEPEGADKFIIYAAVGRNSVDGDDTVAFDWQIVNIVAVCQDASSDFFDDLLAKLNENDISYTVTSEGFDDTRMQRVMELTAEVL